MNEAAADALAAASLLAVDPAGLQGAVLRASPGMLRDRWLGVLRASLPKGTPWRKLPLGAPDSRLLGGLDLAATLAAGRPVAERGVLAEGHGGIVLLAMAERIEAATAARLAAVLDTGEASVQRDGLSMSLPARIGFVALDEGVTAEEAPPAALLERLAFRLELDSLPVAAAQGWAATDVAAARARLAQVAVGEEVVQALCGAALALGIDSLRAPMLALRAARAAAALAGRDSVAKEDAALAARLVLAPRATRLPAEDQPEERPEEKQEQQQEQPPDSAPPEMPDAEALQEMLVAASRAALPAGLLEAMQLREAARRAGAQQGREGARRNAMLRGRPIGTRPGALRGGVRLALVETLRVAAPWQVLRRRERPIGPHLRIHRDDIRLKRFQHQTGTTAIFAVDASGSAALNRLAEAKGAVEMLLAECYARRDQVAVIAFRGRAADLLLPPTNSLVRAKRSLAGLPGGGATPLAAGIEAAAALAVEARRRGRTPLLVVLTDGRANVSRDGGTGRDKAEADALAAAMPLRLAGIPALLVDTSPRPQAYAKRLAEAMGARYLPLPAVDAARLSSAVAATRAA